MGSVVISVLYHRRELPQVSFLSRQTFCCDKQNKCLPRQNTSFVTTKRLLRQIFVTTNIILSRRKFCHDKLTFVATNTCLFVVTKHVFWRKRRKICRNKHEVLSRQAYFCCDKHVFVATKMILVAAPANDSYQITCWFLEICKLTAVSYSFILSASGCQFLPAFVPLRCTDL